MKRFNVFGYVYNLIKKKHPNWTHKQLTRTTMYALGMWR